MSVTVYTMTHKAFEVPTDPVYVPLQVGAEGKEDFGYLRDNTGDNISQLNPYYAELSGMYWVWKNVVHTPLATADSFATGVCHYRRYPVNSRNVGMSAKEYEDILKEYDLITSKQLELPNPYYVGYKLNHNIRDLDLVGSIIKDLYPDDYPVYDEVIHGYMTYFGNIMVAPKALFDEYCQWLFPIFFEAHKVIGAELDGYDNYHKRVYGFISEILLLVFVKARKLKPYECRIGMLGEKKETIELKKQLSALFSKKDALGAQRLFEATLKTRPDVMMEASDISGELKLCMQVISTCSFELDSGKDDDEPGSRTCILDSINEFGELMTYFEELNREMVGVLRCRDDKKIHEIINNPILFVNSAGDRIRKELFDRYYPTREMLYVSYEVNKGKILKNN